MQPQPQVFLNGALCVSTDDLGTSGDYTWHEGDDWPSFHFRLKDGDVLSILFDGRHMVATMGGGRFRNGLTALVASVERRLGAQVRVTRDAGRLPTALVVVLPPGNAELEAARGFVQEALKKTVLDVPVLVREAGPAGDAREAAWRLGDGKATDTD